ncbi:hypothetical protein AQUSIP_01270 [Aquicella siphonis]|uniref:Uncharacterized protein n=1 Tax=Aquicella siphonis TaxID=254247 RepID=A0A5E4PEL4_9COXI|nr:hypothetical protein [Aquicella siphonis]VVC74853.1 hypothetical protein AQUSIP_01270 [Aquicella siphonis]
MQRTDIVTQKAKVELTTTMPGGFVGKASGTATILKTLEHGKTSKVEIQNIDLVQIEGGVMFAYLKVLGNAVIDNIDDASHLAHLAATIKLCGPKYYLMAAEMVQPIDQNSIPYRANSDESHVEAEFTTYISSIGGQISQKIVADVIPEDKQGSSFSM